MLYHAAMKLLRSLVERPVSASAHAIQRILVVGFVVGYALILSRAPVYAQAGHPTVTYVAGWNLVGGNTGQTFPGAIGPLYTLQASDTNYEVLPQGSPIVAGRGYWTYFSSSTTVVLVDPIQTSVTINAPAGRYIMVGNPSSPRAVTVSGADIIYQFDPTTSSYTVSADLPPGRGAWVYSHSGGALILGSGAAPSGPPAPNPRSALPSPPSDLQGVALSPTSVQFSWTSTSSNEDGFELRDAQTGGVVAGTPAGATSVTLPQLMPNSTYCAVVLAFNAAGYSAPSNQTCVVTPP